MKQTAILLFTALVLVSCGSTANNKLIIGKWQGAEWLADGKPSIEMDAKAASFSFNEKGEYSYNYANNKETGTYKVENDMLFTKPANEQELMVKIIKLTKDSLVFNMNRGGQQETLTLLRKQ